MFSEIENITLQVFEISSQHVLDKIGSHIINSSLEGAKEFQCYHK